ncbi:alpha/beta hydrolase [Pedobacter nyackensis]|uniref:Esterase/lipase superfamily enzyme n=1 Tax=Pedobacter nyackensis TaxID=475255 RepID=A0A1W2A0P7_9SPHI|nr:alpha/beta hydrolase [Pedobacter nyackensis]SMC53981.1 Esterase/lipase superfamily enzyme [Pedobacter nyackensis]
MNVTIILEFAEEVRTRSVIVINGEKLDLNRSKYDGNFRLIYELKNYKHRYIEFMLYSPTDFTTRNIQITVIINGRRFGSMVEKLTRTPTVQKIKLSGSDEWERKYSEHSESESQLPKYRKVKKGSNWRTQQGTNESNVSTEPSEYSYFEKQKPREDLLSKKSDEVKNTEVEVFYATNRKKKITKKNRITYTNSRGDLSIGKCLVSVPGDRSKGEFPLPAWYLFGSSTDENNYIILKEVSELGPKEFFNQIGEKVNFSPEKDAFLFVHGYNVSFTESVSRAAQIAVDIGFNGAPLVYSWPSRKNMFWYTADEATASGYSTDDIIQLLIQIRKTGAERIHIIAHSMGNRLITDALRSLVDQGFNKDFLFNQIILAAPDIDAEVFVKQIAPKLVQSSERVTMYASGGDIALWFSAGIHGKILRAGKVTQEIAIADGIDTVDASKETTDLLGHGYFAHNSALIDDIFQLTRHGLSPADRNLRKKESGEHTYWEFW